MDRVSSSEHGLLEAQTGILESILADRPLTGVLESIARLIERYQPGAVCSILHLDRDRPVVRDVAARGLPPDYRQTIEGAAVAADARLRAGEAAPDVHVPEIAIDPRWRDHATLPLGLRPHWSTPVRVDGRIAATLSIESPTPRTPDADERRLVAFCTPLVALAIQSDTDRRARDDAEGRYRTLVEQLPVVTYVDSADGRDTFYVSPQVEDLLGMTAEEFVDRGAGDDWYAMLHEDDRGRLQDAWLTAVANDATFRGEYRIQRPDGRWIWLREIEQVVRDERGRAVARQGVLLDVSVEAEAIEALRQTESRYRALVEQLPAVTYVDDVDAGHQYTSPQIEELVGMTPAEWGLRWQDVIHPDDRERVVSDYEQRLVRREGFQIEYRVVTPADRLIWISERATVVDEPGGGGYVQGLMFDVTELKRAEQAALESERHFREMLEGAQLAALVTQPDGSVSFCNQHFSDLVGWPIDEIVGCDWIEMFCPIDDNAADTEFFEQLLHGRVIPHMVDVVQTITGERRHLRWSNSPIRDQAGNVTAAVSIGEDVTDRMRAERALLDSEERRRHVLAQMLRAAEEERVRIATELHDDTVQVMAATLISLDRFSSAIAAGDGVRMAASVAAARETLNAAVDRTRRLTFELRPPLLEAQGLESALRDLTETAAAEGSFECGVAIDVGRYPELVETLTYRIAQEAITNVRKHAAAGHLWLVLREQDGCLIGEVRDDGCGFDVERALDRSAMRLHMGIDTMAERVRLAGGEVVITSDVGSGTTIGFRIPLA